MSRLAELALPDRTNAEILETARRRGEERGVAYAGCVLPAEAFALISDGAALLIDVRSKAEWELVGRVPGSALVEWRGYPCADPNPRFLDKLAEHAGPDDIVLFLCRSGQRSHQAAEAAARAGYTRAFNVLEGFEGDLDADRRRGHVNGWRKAGLPWIQN